MPTLEGLDLIAMLGVAGFEEELFQYEMAASVPAE